MNVRSMKDLSCLDTDWVPDFRKKTWMMVLTQREIHAQLESRGDGRRYHTATEDGHVVHQDPFIPLTRSRLGTEEMSAPRARQLGIRLLLIG